MRRGAKPRIPVSVQDFRVLQLLCVELDELRHPCGCCIHAVSKRRRQPTLRLCSVEKPRGTMTEISTSPMAMGTSTGQRITDVLSAMNEFDEEEGMMMSLLVHTNNGEARATGTRIDLHEDGLKLGVLDQPIRQTNREREEFHDASSARLQESSRPSGSARHQRPVLPVQNKNGNGHVW